MTPSVLPHRALGASSIDVSMLSLGSWMTFEHMSKEAGVAVMQAARESGIDFLDDARYDDRTGTAPIPTGYSEVLFGELFRGSGWRREDAVVANKLWLEFWPDQSPADELDGSLTRMRFDYLDLVYCAPPQPNGLALVDLVAAVGALASEMDVTPVALAVVFALSNRSVASVLFGATSPEQVQQNVRAVDVLVAATDAQLDALRRIGASAT